MWNWWKKSDLIGTRSVKIGPKYIFRWAFRTHDTSRTGHWPELYSGFWWMAQLYWHRWSIEIIWDFGRWKGVGNIYEPRKRRWYYLPPQNPFASRKK